MELLASCSFERSRSFNGTLTIPGEEGKSNKVSLNIVVDNGDEGVFTDVAPSVKCITFVGDSKASFCPTSLEGKVFNQYSLEDLLLKQIKPVNGIVDLVVLPNDYSDMRILKEYCKSYPSVRFTGGNLLGIEGVRIGRFDKGKERMSPVFVEVYDSFVEVDLDDLSGIQEKVRKAKVKMESLDGEKKSKSKKSSGPKEPKEKKVSKRVEAFNNIFGGSTVDF